MFVIERYNQNKNQYKLKRHKLENLVTSGTCLNSSNFRKKEEMIFILLNETKIDSNSSNFFLNFDGYEALSKPIKIFGGGVAF
ncbi:hypothetical protein BpHYR1_004131 [Brachionus plicatilis]|uniref:Uncharacterized protein n=1 Tax=Brachionus plicatilis TaxID=10195 RepID=A0A3M7QH61_BRAPC|nr:hypothetical protein BpHYR1_004131 [Brachionus plicatilis]